METKAQHPISDFSDSLLKNMRSLVDSNAVIGQAINLPDGTSIIPVSKLSFGGGTGGADFPVQKPGTYFGAGGAMGASIEPIAFLVVQGGSVRMMEINTANNSVDRLVNMIPQMVDRVVEMLSKKERKGPKSASSENEFDSDRFPEEL